MSENISCPIFVLLYWEPLVLLLLLLNQVEISPAGDLLSSHSPREISNKKKQVVMWRGRLRLIKEYFFVLLSPLFLEVGLCRQ